MDKITKICSAMLFVCAVVVSVCYCLLAEPDVFFYLAMGTAILGVSVPAGIISWSVSGEKAAEETEEFYLRKIERIRSATAAAKAADPAEK